MMEIDRMSYIFGSFTRRRQSQEVGSAKRRSIEQPASKISHDRSKSAPQSTKTKGEAQTPRAKSVCDVVFDESKFKCQVCQKQFVEPRVLPCLHTFCTRCLLQLQADECPAWRNGSDVSLNGKTDSSGDSAANISGGSGYVSDRRDTPEVTWSPTTNVTATSSGDKRLSCPSCGLRSKIPAGGILALPTNYLVQHRIVLAALNSHSTKLLCDLCTNDTTATCRCTECALSLCQECADEHRRQRISAHHEVLGLEEARRKGITRVRRQVMCSSHPEHELSAFCSSCCQVVCRECVSGSHRGHMYEPMSRAAKAHTSNIKLALGRTRCVAEKSAMSAIRLQTTSKRIESHCDHVQDEIEKFIEAYIRAIEKHRNDLRREVNQAKDDKLNKIEKHSVELQRKLNEARDVVSFAEQLLNEGTDVEILSFVKPILNRLEQCNRTADFSQVKVSESLQFLPDEIVQDSDSRCPLYGVISTQTVAPSRCVLLPEGLQNLRVGRRVETVLETRDVNDSPLQRGGECVFVELRHRDSGAAKTLTVHVDDRRDGTYRLIFIPDVAGKYLLSVQIKGQPIKDSPYQILVRPFRPHHGTFHCCSFCSSGGNKDAACGCGGKMPGGYKGCGHGHEGHPGRRHWSCCGNTLEHSECGRRNSTHYQFTL